MPNFANICAWISDLSGSTDPFTFLGGLVNAALPADALTDGLTYGYSAYYSDGVTVGYETGTGVYVSASNHLTRVSVETSSNSNNAVNWSGAAVIVEIVLTAAQLNASLAQRYTDMTSGGPAHFGTLSGTVNGVNATFTCDQGSYIAGSTFLWANGQPFTDYTETTPGSGIITLGVAPPTGTVLTLTYDS